MRLSLLCQEHLYEICVSDDCSSDRTWEILNEYSSRYPGLFKLNRNDPNLGIFANEEKTWEMPTGDIIYRIAGDDMCCEGYFKAVVDFISEKGIRSRTYSATESRYTHPGGGFPYIRGVRPIALSNFGREKSIRSLSGTYLSECCSARSNITLNA